MIFSNNTFYFKSLPRFYDKEKTDLKNNTFRILSDDELVLLKQNYHTGNHLFINIQNVRSNESFTRSIRDISWVSYKGETFAIFTWEDK